MTFSEFLSMGGYGFYVWTSWGIALVTMSFLVIRAISKRRSILKNLSDQAVREQFKVDNKDDA